jgi:RHS repeat-associated protein
VAIARHGGPAEGRHTDHSASGATSISYTMLRRSCMIPFWVCAPFTDAIGHPTTVLYTDLGLPGELVDANGNVTKLGYDGSGNLVSASLPGGATYSYDYDASGNLTSMTDPLDLTTTFAYDLHNDVTSYTDAKGDTTQYGYDADKNLLSITYANGARQTYSYDPLGEANQFINARGNAINSTYNSVGELTKQSFADGTSFTFGYDTRGNLTSAKDGQGNTTTFVYGGDANNPNNPDLLTEVEYPDSTFLKFSYYPGGLREQSVDQTGYTLNYTYDAADRLTALTAGITPIVQYTYDSAGQLTQKDNGNNTRTVYTYDNAGNVLTITNYAPDHTTVNSFDNYSYDGQSNVLTDTNQDGKWVYTYDADSQLIGAVFTLNATDPDGLSAQNLQYVYDAAGNRISETVNGVVTNYLTNNVNEYTSSTEAGIGTTTYQYDLDGNLIATLDSSNNTTNYTFNDLNQLTAVNGPGLSASYFYDPLGNRISQTVSGITTNFQFDPTGSGNEVAAFGGSGVYSDSGGLQMHYSYGFGLVSQTDAIGNSNYYDFGLTGSTIGITNAAGGYVSRYSYLPFGEIAKMVGAANPFAYLGLFGVNADDSGQLSMGVRNYNPARGGFISNDPISLAGGDANIRRYARNNPVTSIDPSGLGPSPAGGAGEFKPIPDPIYGPPAPTPTSPEPAVPPGGFDPGGPNYAPISGPQLPVPAAPNPGTGLQLPKDPVNDLVKFWWGKDFNDLSPKDKFAFWQIYVYAMTPVLWWAFNAAGGHFMNPLQMDPIPPVEFPPFFYPDFSPPTPDEIKRIIDIFGSGDPNNLVGPAGFSAQNFVTPQDPLPYTIEFENDPNKATVAAEDVVVTQQLDANLDWSTFQLGTIQFGATTIAVPTALQSYSTSVMTTNIDGTPLRVDIDAALDQDTGIVTWTFHSIDPTTGLTPDDPVAGFLPVDDATHRGEASVSYTVSPKASDSTGAAINAQASVVFDTNAPLSTVAVQNPVASVVDETSLTQPSGTATPSAVTIGALLGTHYTDTDKKTKPGIAVIATEGTGTWQYKVGSKWVNIGPVTLTNALLLPKADSLRFLANGFNTDPVGLIYVAWDGATGKAGQYANASAFGGGATLSAGAGKITVSQTTATAAPEWLAKSTTLASIPPGTSGPIGETVAQAFGGVFSGDNSQAAGIAITGVTGTTSGTWEYNPFNNGTQAYAGWQDFPKISPAAALLLADQDMFAFVPKAASFAGAAALTVRGWDQSSGTDGGTANLSKKGSTGGQTAFSANPLTATLHVNTSPTQTPPANGITLPAIAESVTSAAVKVSTLLKDAVAVDSNKGTQVGLAITGVTGPGVWQYELAGRTWQPVPASFSLLLPPTAKLRFVPTIDTTGTATLTWVAWDQTQGIAGMSGVDSTSGTASAFSAASATASLTISAVNHPAPEWNGSGTALTPVLPGDYTPTGAQPPGDSVQSVFGAFFQDGANGASVGIAITGLTGATSGVWQYSLDGITWTAIGTVSTHKALLLSADYRIRFVPKTGYTGVVTLAAYAWDGSQGQPTSPFNISGKTGGSDAFSALPMTVSCLVNKAPVLSH